MKMAAEGSIRYVYGVFLGEVCVCVCVREREREREKGERGR